MPPADPHKDFGTIAYRYQRGADLFKTALWSWHECPYCRKVAINFPIWDTTFPCKCFPGNFIAKMEETRMQFLASDEDGAVQQLDADHIEWWMNKVLSMYDTDESPRLVKAYTAARSARFEYGEKGASQRTGGA
jgi:hypothetical protein